MGSTIFSARDGTANHAPAEVYNWRIYFLAISAAMGSAMFGYDSAFIGGTLSFPAFQNRFGLAGAAGTRLANLNSNIVSTFQAGCFFGAIVVYYLTEKLSRKVTLMICGVVLGIGAILASNGHFGGIYAGRVLTELAVGASSLVVPVYISESSPPAIRGRLVGTFECLLQFFQVIGFWINYGVNIHIPETSDAQWHIPFGFQLVPAGFLIIFMMFQPNHRASSSKQSKWKKRNSSFPNFVNLMGTTITSSGNNMVQQQIDQENMLGANKSLWAKLKEAFSARIRYRIFLSMALMIFQNLSGINALNYYSSTIFQSIGFNGTSVGLLATGVFGIVKATSTLVFIMFGIDRLDRRRAMLIGSAGAIVALYHLAGYSALSQSFTSGTVSRDGGAYAAIVMVYLFAVFYAMSWNALKSSQQESGLCLVFTTCLIVYSTPYVMTDITYGTFVFFSTSVVVGVLMVWLSMPEIKGLSIEEMDILFAQKGMARHKRQKTDLIIAESIANGVTNAVILDGKVGKTEEVETV